MANCIDCGKPLDDNVVIGRCWECFKRAYGHDQDEPEPTRFTCADCMGEGCADCDGRGYFES